MKNTSEKRIKWRESEKPTWKIRTAEQYEGKKGWWMKEEKKEECWRMKLETKTTKNVRYGIEVKRTKVKREEVYEWKRSRRDKKCAKNKNKKAGKRGNIKKSNLFSWYLTVFSKRFLVVSFFLLNMHMVPPIKIDLMFNFERSGWWTTSGNMWRLFFN